VHEAYLPRRPLDDAHCGVPDVVEHSGSRGILIRVELALAPAEDVERDVPEAWSKATCRRVARRGSVSTRPSPSAGKRTRTGGGLADLGPNSSQSHRTKVGVDHRHVDLGGFRCPRTDGKRSRSRRRRKRRGEHPSGEPLAGQDACTTGAASGWPRATHCTETGADSSWAVVDWEEPSDRIASLRPFAPSSRKATQSTAHVSAFLKSYGNRM